MKGKIVQQKNNLRITKYGKTYYVYNPSGVLLGTFLNKKDAFDFCSSNKSFTIKRGINDNDIIDKFKPIIRASFKSNYDCADAPNCLTVISHVTKQKYAIRYKILQGKFNVVIQTINNNKVVTVWSTSCNKSNLVNDGYVIELAKHIHYQIDNAITNRAIYIAKFLDANLSKYLDTTLLRKNITDFNSEKLGNNIYAKLSVLGHDDWDKEHEYSTDTGFNIYVVGRKNNNVECIITNIKNKTLNSGKSVCVKPQTIMTDVVKLARLLNRLAEKEYENGMLTVSQVQELYTAMDKLINILKVKGKCPLEFPSYKDEVKDDPCHAIEMFINKYPIAHWEFIFGLDDESKKAQRIVLRYRELV